MPVGSLFALVLFYGSLYLFARWVMREATDSLTQMEASLIVAQNEAIEKAAVKAAEAVSGERV